MPLSGAGEVAQMRSRKMKNRKSLISLGIGLALAAAVGAYSMTSSAQHGRAIDF